MDNIVIKEWNNTKQELLDSIDEAIRRNIVDVDTLRLMKEMLIVSRIKHNKNRSISIDTGE